MIRQPSESGNGQGGVIRYAVVGLGYIAQIAVLPAFKHAKYAELSALVSDDPVKLRSLGNKYKVTRRYSYDHFEACLASGEVDAVYIALPNHLHCEYAVRAAEAGCHVLCEKPMAVTEHECERMIGAAVTNNVRLMIAYRLHFEEANLRAVELARSGELGRLRFFASTFAMQVKPGDIRVRRETGGGTLYDIGIYCINAARYLFRDEPYEVFAFSTHSDDPRFREVDEMTSAVLRFPQDRLATFTSSFGAADVSTFTLAGTQGCLCVEQAYEYTEKITHHLTINGKTRSQSFGIRDQFAPELDYFARCILDGKEPEPSGQEGLADVRIIEALYQSAAKGHPEKIEPVEKITRPTIEQEIHHRRVTPPKLVHAQAPTVES